MVSQQFDAFVERVGDVLLDLIDFAGFAGVRTKGGSRMIPS